MSVKMTSETEVDMMFSKKFKFKVVQQTSSEKKSCTEDLSWMVRLVISLMFQVELWWLSSRFVNTMLEIVLIV